MRARGKRRGEGVNLTPLNEGSGPQTAQAPRATSGRSAISARRLVPSACAPRKRCPSSVWVRLSGQRRGCGVMGLWGCGSWWPRVVVEAAATEPSVKFGHDHTDQPYQCLPAALPCLNHVHAGMLLMSGAGLFDARLLARRPSPHCAGYRDPAARDRVSLLATVVQSPPACSLMTRRRNRPPTF